MSWLRPARVVATTRIGLKRATEEGRLRDDLSQRLDRLQFRLPALRDRREDVLPLTECLCRRLAREERAPVPSFSDESLALLWRQPWDGNVRELESFVYKLVLLGSGDQRRAVRPIEPAHILEIARRFSLQMVQRLPSRHPSRGDLLAALRVTRKPGGRLNKTRAALYLGWDPDTLVARMQDAGIGEEIEGERAWATLPTPTDQEPGEPAT
jgi:DNA-binding NtrC family response regulator